MPKTVLTDAAVAKALGWRKVFKFTMNGDRYHDWYFGDKFIDNVEDMCKAENSFGFRPTTHITHVLDEIKRLKLWWEMAPAVWSKKSGVDRYQAIIKDVILYSGTAENPAMALSMALVAWAKEHLQTPQKS